MTDQDAGDGQKVYNYDVSEVGIALKEAFSDPDVDEAVVIHPIDGRIVVTRKEFYDHVKRANKALNMSPSDKLMERKRLERIAHQKRTKLRTAMITAKVHTCDMSDDENFGKDVDGVVMDIEGMVFVGVDRYPEGIDLNENEVGAFIKEDFAKKPIRVLAKEMPSGGGAAR